RPLSGGPTADATQPASGRQCRAWDCACRVAPPNRCSLGPGASSLDEPHEPAPAPLQDLASELRDRELGPGGLQGLSVQADPPLLNQASCLGIRGDEPGRDQQLGEPDRPLVDDLLGDRELLDLARQLAVSLDPVE